MRLTQKMTDLTRVSNSRKRYTKPSLGNPDHDLKPAIFQGEGLLGKLKADLPGGGVEVRQLDPHPLARTEARGRGAFSPSASFAFAFAFALALAFPIYRGVRTRMNTHAHV